MLMENLNEEILISKQAVLDIDFNRICLTTAKPAEMIREVIGKLSSVKQEPKTGWIPVSERLPEERKAVLVYAPEYDNIYCAYLDGDTWFIFGGYGSYAVANVIAWMPLPKPYLPDTNIGNMSENPTGSKDVIWYSNRNYSEIVVEPQERSE